MFNRAIAFVRSLLAAFVARFLVVNIDRTVGSLESLAARLDRAADQQRARFEREMDAAAAAYERAIAANREGARAMRVRDRVRDLIA